MQVQNIPVTPNKCLQKVWNHESSFQLPRTSVCKNLQVWNKGSQFKIQVNCWEKCNWVFLLELRVLGSTYEKSKWQKCKKYGTYPKSPFAKKVDDYFQIECGTENSFQTMGYRRVFLPEIKGSWFHVRKNILEEMLVWNIKSPYNLLQITVCKKCLRLFTNRVWNEKQFPNNGLLSKIPARVQSP